MTMENPNFQIPLLPQHLLDSIPHKHLDVPYCGSSSSHKLDIYLPAQGSKPYPVVLHVHGGAFLFGTRRDVNLVPMLRVLQRGYALVSVGYRLSGEARFPALIWDAKAAVRFLRANADCYGIDASRIAAWGPSAGGYIVSMLGVTGGNPAFEDLSMGNAEYSSSVQAVVDWCGPCGGFLGMDPAIEHNGVGDSDHNAPQSPESRLMGAPIPTIPALVELANPCRYASADTPPFLIQHGEMDGTVPVQQSRALAAAIAAAAGSDRVKLETFAGRGHHGEPWYEEPIMSERVLDFLDNVLSNDPGKG